MTKDELELIKLAKAGDTMALEDIFAIYKNMVVGISRKYFLVGGDTEDLIQEGMMGLFKAVVSYNENKNDNFKAYAYTIIVHEILGAVRHNNTDKVKSNNEMLFFDDEDGIQFAEDNLNPEEEVIQNEKVEGMLSTIKSHLSDFENKVLSMYLDGYNYRDIATRLHKTDKSIDNALNRIKSKLQYLKGE